MTSQVPSPIEDRPRANTKALSEEADPGIVGQAVSHLPRKVDHLLQFAEASISFMFEVSKKKPNSGGILL